MPAVPVHPTLRPSWGWWRWTWRTLVSMRTAVALLCLLALAAVPGSLLPQRGVASDPNAVPQFFVDHPRLGPWLDRAGLFEVYAAPWFAAIYLLLLVSMLGCVLPRSLRLWRNVRARPVAGPPRLERLEQHRSWNIERERISDARLAATSALRAARFRVDIDRDEVRAEKGYLRELGNLGFHLSLLILLVGVGYGKLVGFEGRVVVVEGQGFTNTRSQYDEFTAATLTDLRELTPFSMTLDAFDVVYANSGPNLGQPLVFDATVSVTKGTGAGAETTIVRPNEPLNVDGTKMFVTGNGYAPVITVRDAKDNVVTSGPVVFLPTDQNYGSSGVIKAPDAQPEGLAFEGVFLPTAATGTAAPISAFPDLQNPQILLTGYSGDLGLDRGPQSVFVIDKSNLTQLSVDAKPFQISLAPGETVELPDGRGSLTFERVDRFVNFQVAYDPGRQIALLAAILLLVGLTASLTIPRRRWWLRVVESQGSARVELGGQSLTRRSLPDRDLRRLESALAPLLGDASDSLHDDRRYAHVRD
ncbi:cytochrome c biogenesis protein ResB [Nocardioides halotolerans]|uniref:cytochrome c biogenesis protein ResB n=1 Tax=Nocardioides halotolerans TaxID=433660 RepID=UPI00040D02A7|nr:cytochrome c biogenesis protein ResB [Nocardioides halotolerans]